MYAGMRALGGQTEAVVNWSDDDNASNQMDRLSFVFTSTPDSTSMANTYNGLEIARMCPDTSGNQGFLGVGDFRSAVANPTERLHVLSGRVRIQQLPDNPEAPSLTKVLVVDDSPSPNGERGVLKWRNINNLTSCDWQIQPNNDVASVYGGSACPWTSDNFVGIGQQYPKAKLEVYHDGTSPNFSGDVTLSTLRSGTAG